MSQLAKRSYKLNRAEGTNPPAKDKEKEKKEVNETNYTIWIVAAVALIIGVYLYMKGKKR